MNFSEHYIIIDHTDNSGLSVHRPTQKDIELFEKYGTMECGNTTHVVPYRKIRELEEKLRVAKEALNHYSDPPRVDNGPLPWYDAWNPAIAKQAITAIDKCLEDK